MNISIYKKHVLTVAIILFMGVTAQAQISFPDDVNDEAPAAPIDGVIGIALATGAYIGLRKKYKSQ